MSIGRVDETQLAVDHHDLQDLAIEDVLVHIVQELLGKLQKRGLLVVFERCEACQHYTVVDYVALTACRRNACCCGAGFELSS